MSYTNADLLRQHLSSPYPTLQRVYDQLVILRTLDPVQFFGGAIDPDTLTVKNLQTKQLTRITKSFASGSVSVGENQLVRDSVLIASDSSLGTVFTENLDYIVDYEAGTINRKSGGALSDAVVYAIWYAVYHTYLIDVDYEINSDNGEIIRLNTGGIAAGETVLLDYAPVFASFGDETLQFAAIEANAVVEMEVDPQQQYGGNPILQAAATCVGLAVVCRSAASRELSRLRGEQQTASGWMKLADSYAERGEQLLKAFRPPMTGPTSPAHD